MVFVASVPTRWNCNAIDVNTALLNAYVPDSDAVRFIASVNAPFSKALPSDLCFPPHLFGTEGFVTVPLRRKQRRIFDDRRIVVVVLVVVIAGCLSTAAVGTFEVIIKARVGINFQKGSGSVSPMRTTRPDNKGR